ncbi:actin-related protein 5 isoform X2 [Anthonomus grandis grandis]|uniref:actin-related protein 5 isoform X2 n=1 Tax=Anthonomus grandis grandis TaxID=2921223 RepID=UPI002165BEA8|nr:actin-related protein 5 isoform X2 [Anthonomus grandis grandis]
MIKHQPVFPNPTVTPNLTFMLKSSYTCKVGWATDPEPLLQFRNLIAKPRRERSKKDTIELPQTPQLQVGNDIVNIEAVRFQLKTQFDRNVVTHFEAQEHLLDYAFSHLGINTENCVPHPVLCTEALLNPNTSRQLMSELLFECYNIPAVCYGIDSLFGYYCFEEKPPDFSGNALIVHLGYQTCHIIPILDNQVVFENTRRLNTGGFHIVNFLHRLLQLKYPVHATSITLSRAEEILHRLCKVATDYREELKRWANVEFYEGNVKKIQLPFTFNPVNTAITLEQQKERKRELARRLIEINARKREERLAEDEERIGQLLDIKEMVEMGADRQTVERTLLEFQIKNVSELEKNILHLNNKIEKTKQKILAASNNVDEIDEPPPPKQSKYSKMAFESDKELFVFLQNIKKMRQEILTKKMIRKQRKQDMAKRRTAAGQERMRIISQLARKEKGNDDFGMRDEDWDIYKTISKDGGDSDSEAENEKLLEFDEILRAHEPSELGESSQPGEAHQLHIGVEMYRGPELLFKPYMFGSQEAGLSEVIGYVLSLFDEASQLKLASNVLITGALANLPGLKERILTDLISIRPFKSTVNIAIIKSPSLASWYGARNFAKSEEFKDSLLTKKMYQEMGPEYFKVHKCSNPYIPSPSISSSMIEVVDVI